MIPIRSQKRFVKKKKKSELGLEKYVVKYFKIQFCLTEHNVITRKFNSTWMDVLKCKKCS